ncbi:MAG: guanylate kinase [Clostridiales bacterium]|nr:guanylate kinase [Clostridiales bacterium]
MFIVFSGISGCGKNTIMNELMKRRDNLKVLELSTGTTREPRESDKENNTYIFMTKEEFERGIRDGKFYEYENVHGNYYGTLLERLEFASKSEKVHYMRDVDVKGFQSLKKFFAGKCKMVGIFIDVPDHLLRERLVKRGESEESINKRLSRGELERASKGKYDLVVENIDLNKTVDEIDEFLDL